MAHANVVLEHEDRLGAGGKFIRAWFFVGRWWRGRDFRQKNSHGGPFAELALDTDMAAALPDDSVTGGQPESAAALVLRGEERLEKMLPHFVSHAAAVIRHADPNIFSGRKFFRAAFVIVCRFDGDRSRFQGETSAVCH